MEGTALILSWQAVVALVGGVIAVISGIVTLLRPIFNNKNVNLADFDVLKTRVSDINITLNSLCQKLDYLKKEISNQDNLNTKDLEKLEEKVDKLTEFILSRNNHH